jgi:DNA invertase Pin-like site-specific DNA recombinase
MMAAFAELERDLIRERTMAGLAPACAHWRAGFENALRLGGVDALPH